MTALQVLVNLDNYCSKVQSNSSVKMSVSEARLRWLTELIFQIRHSMGILECQRRPPGLQMLVILVCNCNCLVILVARVKQLVSKLAVIYKYCNNQAQYTHLGACCVTFCIAPTLSISPHPLAPSLRCSVCAIHASLLPPAGRPLRI